MRLLVVEDSPELIEPLVAGLKRSGYTVDHAADGRTGLWMAQGDPYDLIILDIMLPGLDGLGLLKRLRDANNPVRVLLLTARDTVADRVHGLRAGADDYLIKPFSFDELLARIEALLRRAKEPAVSEVMTIDRVTVDLRAKLVLLDGHDAQLTPREFAIVEHLSRNRGRVVSRAEIERHVYDDNAEVQSNVVDSAICAIRRKLDRGNPPGSPSFIQTRRGHGYVVGTATLQESNAG